MATCVGACQPRGTGRACGRSPHLPASVSDARGHRTRVRRLRSHTSGWALLDSDWRRAADLNLLVLLIPLLATLLVILQRLSGRRQQWFYAVLTVLALWTVVRNVPGLSGLRADA